MNLATPRITLPTCAAVQRSGSRGFTLVELLTVVGIIAIFAAIALPTVANRMRERRTAQVAHQLVQTYRTAKMRAMGRGSAVLVRYDETTDKAVMTREAIAGAASNNSGCVLSTISSCINPVTRWDDPTQYREIDKFSPFSHAGLYELTRMEFRDGLITKRAQFDVCFTPSGNAFWRSSFAATAFQQLNDVPSIWVWSQDSDGKHLGPDRYVYLLPNGVARVGQ
ncbi:MAG: prepilin-type N-terminal cleavage/methylation domain-containing protein [Deltaproteobacteria bacterium]|nr:prepilin-type N-terminal cleavage/methylation domain-containing protein [Deltaproteobacteria bacterium]